jgi:hypothetical protein
MHHWLPLSLNASWIREACGYLAGSLVLCTFSVTSMRPLRCLGIASNCLFISYAIMAGMLPILILHCLLLPINIYRLTQIERDHRHSMTRGLSRSWLTLWGSADHPVPRASDPADLANPAELLGCNSHIDEGNRNVIVNQNVVVN